MITRLLKWIAVLAMLMATLVIIIPSVRDFYTRPVRSVRIIGEFEHVNRDALRKAIDEALQMGFYNIDVDAVRTDAQRLPWVRDVTVQRVWPDSLAITVTERQAVARWNFTALLENDGSVFQPEGDLKKYKYTQLSGPSGKQLLMLEQYKRLATAFGTLAGGIVRVSLSKQGQWQIKFGNGLILVPGMDLDVAVLKVFASTVSRVMGEDLVRARRIDMRYANGFAVRWRTPGTEEDKG